MNSIKSFPAGNSLRLKFSMKKNLKFLGSLILLLTVSFLNITSANAQTDKQFSLEKGESGNNLPFSSGDVDSSLIDNLFTTYGSSGYRASVSALAKQKDGKLLAAGNFSYVNGTAKSLLVRLNPNGSVDTDFNAPGFYPVLNIVPLANGKILISGTFSTYINGIYYRGLVQLNEDGSLDNDFAVDVSGVFRLAVQSDGKIVIVGSFSTVNGFTINNVARLNADGSLDTSFQVGSGASNTVNAVAIQADGKILIGGAFTSYNNIPKPRLARLNVDGSLDTTFNVGDASTSTSGPNSSVSDIIIQPDNKILIGGAFNAVNGATRSAQIARLEPDGTLDNSFAPVNPLSYTSGVRILLQPDGKVIAGFIADVPTTSNLSTLYRFNSTGTLDTSFNSTVKVTVLSLVLEDDGKIIIGGGFSTVNGNFKNALARLNSDGTTDDSFDYVLSFAASAYTIAVQSDGKILIGGNFEYVNQRLKNGIVRLNTDGSIDESFKVTGNFSTNSFALISTIVPLKNGKILIGGNFTTLNGQTVSRIARLNSDGTTDAGFNVGSGPNGAVLSISVQADDKILVAGNFYAFNNLPKKGIVRLDKSGAVDTTFDPPFSFASSVPKVVFQPDGKILLAGSFTLTSGAERSGVVRLNNDGSLDDGFNTSASSSAVRDIVIQPDGKIIVGGSFYGFNGTTIRNIVRLNADGSVDTAFNLGNGANYTVNAVLLQTDGKIWIGGDFTIVNGIRRGRLARLNSDGSLDDFDINPGANLQVLALAQQIDGRLLVGGSFTQIGGLQRVGFARIRLSHNAFTPLFDFDGDGKTDYAVFRAESGAWYKINSSNGNSDGRLFGLSTDLIVPADYDGDGKTDLAVWRPSDGYWYILKSTVNEVRLEQFGDKGDIPVAADFDGDGKADLAVFRPSTGVWYILQSRDGFRAVQFGISMDVPLVGDFDGDGKADIAVYRPSEGTWYILPSAGGFSAVTFGAAEDIPVPGDYDGDGKTDVAVFRPSNGTWYVLGTTQGFYGTQFGSNEDYPVPGDYDGDGKTDVAVYRPSAGYWYVLTSSNQSFKSQLYGAKDDLPIPAAFLKR